MNKEEFPAPEIRLSLSTVQDVVKPFRETKFIALGEQRLTLSKSTYVFRTFWHCLEPTQDGPGISNEDIFLRRNYFRHWVACLY